MLSFLKKMKHLAFLTKKAASQSDYLLRVKDGFFRIFCKVRPYRFKRTRYLESWLRFTIPVDREPQPLPMKIYCVWTGDNPMTPNRARNLKAIREKNFELEVELVTPENLHQFVLPEHPLHPAYEFLSLVHKSDYLRAYLMHFYGGGYSDIKEPRSEWGLSLDFMRHSPDIWVMGYQELSSKMCAQIDGQVGKDVRRNFSNLVGNGGFLVRPGTLFTEEWLAEVDRRLSYYEHLLRQNPGNERGDNVGYPVPWTALLAQIFQPLQLKYLDHVKTDNNLLLSFENYK